MAAQDESTACPNCGNPNLDVDASSNTVYCKNCGFAVQVDPKTGNVTPLNDGTPQGGQAQGSAMPAGGGASYAPGGQIFGLDRMTFVLLGTIVAFLAYLFLFPQDLTVFGLIEVIVLAVWYLKR